MVHFLMLMVSLVQIPEEYFKLEQQYWVNSTARTIDTVSGLAFVVIDLQSRFFLTMQL